jgi:hypothetical protein
MRPGAGGQCRRPSSIEKIHEMYEGATNLQTVSDLLPGYDLAQNWPYTDVMGGDALFKLRD